MIFVKCYLNIATLTKKIKLLSIKKFVSLFLNYINEIQSSILEGKKIYKFKCIHIQNMHFVIVNGLFNDPFSEENLFPSRNSIDFKTLWMHNNKITQAQVLPFLLFLASAILPWKHIHLFYHLIIIMASYDKPKRLGRESKITCLFTEIIVSVCLLLQTPLSHFTISFSETQTEVQLHWYESFWIKSAFYGKLRNVNIEYANRTDSPNWGIFETLFYIYI